MGGPGGRWTTKIAGILMQASINTFKTKPGLEA